MSETNHVANSITLWAFPIGVWTDPRRTRPLLDAFTAETGIQVRIEPLDYETGDQRVRAVMGTEDAPDLIMEGPERLVADWGAIGAMVDLRDMLDPQDRTEIRRSILSACTASDGAVYLYPLVRTVHSMAINVDAFREANALQYVNLSKHTWTTDQFKQAVAALSSRYGDAVAAIYCGGQGGDQGTRALIANFYNGPFTDPEHTRYTWDDPKILSALEDLRAMPGIYFDPYITGTEEIKMFCRGRLKMAFCWNISKQAASCLPGAAPGRTIGGQEITFMAFPAPDGIPKLLPGIWGFGAFRHKDPARLAAAKAFIRFMCDSVHTPDAVQLTSYFAARTAVDGQHLRNIWLGNDIMRAYNTILPFIGENNQIAKGWHQARTAWWAMLQHIGQGGSDLKTLVSRYVNEANRATQ